MYNLNSADSGFSCGYSSNCAKFYSKSPSLDSVVYSMSDNLSETDNNNYSLNFSFENTATKIYDDSENYNKKKSENNLVLNTSAGIDSLYLVGQQNFNPLSFLNPDRPKAVFITNVDELLPIITETFEMLIEETFPDNISINICSESKMKKIHENNSGVWVPSIQGFSLNRNGKGVNEIFVKKDALDSMLLTIGHEIGHVMTHCLADPVDEEAKAFAFSLAWIKIIKENNIGGLAPNISPNPAKNGLHDKAFNFVVRILEQGKSAFQVFKEIAKGEFKSKQIIEYGL